MSDGPGNALHTETAARLEPRARFTAREYSSSELRKAEGQTVCFMGKKTHSHRSGNAEIKPPGY